MKLYKIAKTIRSKNAGPFYITYEIIFDNKEKYEYVKKSNKITKETIAKLFNIPVNRIKNFVFFDPACAIKFSIKRESPSGSAGDTDVYGCQQYPPLLNIEI